VDAKRARASVPSVGTKRARASVAGVGTKRVRRSPEEAREEILRAAEGALNDLELGALTVEILMERTGMTRSSFYHYFKSLDDVIMALFDRVEAEISGAVDVWLEADEAAGDPRDATVAHLTRMYEVWREHANLMRAMEQAAGRNGGAYKAWRGRVVDGYIETTTAFIERQIKAGRCDAPDPAALALALILMNVSVASDQVARPVPEDPARLGAAVGRVWNGAIYGF
jgi:AcrR family transcriptional regulator